jgi:tetratricopeptide (TPR) repeat protein
MFRLLFLLIALVVIMSSVAAQTSLSPVAQKALDAGIASAKAGDYVAAIKTLDDARKSAPDAPAIYFNLGLAESKIPGHEIRAICALEAYLALSPEGANAAAVRTAITNLEAQARANIDKMIEILKVGFAGLNTPPRYGRQPEQSLPVLYLKYGRPDMAETVIQSVKSPDRLSGYSSGQDAARIALMNALIALGRIDDAAKQAALVQDNYRKADVAATMTTAYINAGRFREAKAELEKVNWKFPLLLKLAVAEIKAGLKDDGEARLQDAKQISLDDAKKGDAWDAIVNMPDLAYARWELGQKDAANTLMQETLRQIEAYTEAKSPNAAKVLCLLNYSGTLENMDRHADALKAMDKAEKYWQAEVRNKEEGYGIMKSSTRIYEQYRWLREYGRLEKFIVALGVNTVFDDGMTGLKRWIADHQRSIAAETARVAATDAINKTASNAAATPTEKAAMWMRYSDAFASQPIFTTDFNVMLRNLVDYAPPASDYDKPATVFARVEEPAEAIVDALNNIRSMREHKPIITYWNL